MGNYEKMLELKANTALSSDLHFFHKNIIKFCARTRGDNDSLLIMNEKLVKAHNSVVGPDDNWIFAGDLSFGPMSDTMRLLSRMNGKKYWVVGNHDTSYVQHRLKSQFEKVLPYLEVKIDGQMCCISHYPMVEWNNMHYGSFHFYGHVHGKKIYQRGRSMDIGVDARPDDTLKPWSWSELYPIMMKKPIMQHGGTIVT